MFHRIMHANDGSENSFAALRAAIDLAALADSGLDVLFVEEISPRSGTIGDVTIRDAEQRRRISKRKSLAEKLASRSDVQLATHVLVGHPVVQIIAFARELKADLLVIGATEHADLWEHLFGRRSDRVTHKVACSVLIVREGGHNAA
jgi:nucleotide-binding universal stress UspA family protein